MGDDGPRGWHSKIWEKTGWKPDEVDLYEINEAFAVQSVAVIRELGMTGKGKRERRRGSAGTSDRRQWLSRAGYIDL